MRRFVSRAVVPVIGGLVLAIASPAASPGQDAQTKGQPAAPAPAHAPVAADRTPMSRFVPLENLILYFECDGLEAHADAWKQTAAYKILNNTPTGEMFEEVLAQVIEQKFKKPAAPTAAPPGSAATPDAAMALMGAMPQPTLPAAFQKSTGAEIVTMLKHMLNKGFVFAINAPGPKNETGSTILVIRGAAKTGVSKPFAKVLGASWSATAKFKKAVRASRNMILVEDPDPKFTKDWGWWGEKDKDLVIAFNSAKAARRRRGHRRWKDAERREAPARRRALRLRRERSSRWCGASSTLRGRPPRKSLARPLP